MGHVLGSRAFICLVLGCDSSNLAQVRAATTQINVLQDSFRTTALITGLGHCKSSLEILYVRFFCSFDRHHC